MNDTDELIARIGSAFADVPYPGDDRLTDSSYGEEPAALVEDFRGRTDWRVLDAGFLDAAPQGWSTALAFFSGRALHFYLPAYLLADLRGQLVHGSDPSFRLCYWLERQAELAAAARTD